MKTFKLIGSLILSGAALLGFVLSSSKATTIPTFAYDGLTAPAITATFDTSSALVFERDSEQTSITVSEMIPYTGNNTFFEFDNSGDFAVAQEIAGNKKYHALLVPVTFSMHLDAKKQVTFSELNLQVRAYKTTSNGSAACVAELLSDIPEAINGAANNTGSTYSLARTYTTSTTTYSANYDIGEYTFVNNSTEEADVYLPGTYYFVVIVRWASGYDHLGFGQVGIGNKYCTDVRGINDKDIQIEFDNDNTVYYRQEGSDASSISYDSMSPVEFTAGENEIYDATFNNRLAIFKEKSMNKYFNVIIIPFRFYVNLGAYEMVTVSEFNISLTIRKIATGGIAGAFVELFSARPDVITTTWNAKSSPNYSVGRISTSTGCTDLSLIHQRIATSCSTSGYSFVNNSALNQDVYTDNYYYLTICGNYASTYDHIVEATMNVVPAEGDSVISYSRSVTLNGTNCTFNGGTTANYQSQYNATIIPSTHYTYPTSVEITMGEETLVRNTHYSYNSITGQITINANVVTDDIVINVISIPATYVVTYSSNGGTGSTTSSNGAYNEIINLRTCTFSKHYYSFLEWNSSEDGNGTSYDASDEYTITGDVTLYAIWHQTDKNIVDQYVGIELHFDVDVISTGDNSDTGACHGEEGLYQIAKTAYNSLSDDQKELFCTNSSYTNARARLNAWAVANGETLNTSTYQLQKASRYVSPIANSNNNGEIIIVIISLASLLAIGSYAFLKIRKKEK